jgi:A/G-specific adenine glycosylase
MQVAVLDWYAGSGRSLAFRGATDPYEILVSELMAQQTQASRAAAVWRTFLAAFPSVADLAAATPAAVLRAWRGLGYNRRALALRRAAQVVMRDHGGRLPEAVEALERLPGIGPYTARAVAALAFGQRVGAVDTNVRRVLSRAALGLEPGDIGGRSSAAAGAVQQLADAAVPTDRAGEWTHALMDMGALICRPMRPRCTGCPLRAWCRSADRLAAADGGRSQAPAPGGSFRSTPKTPTGFASTSRWLRGRIVDRLCDAPDGEWVALPDRVGVHGPEALAAALESLRHDGLAELHPSLERRARLPLA